MSTNKDNQKIIDALKKIRKLEDQNFSYPSKLFNKTKFNFIMKLWKMRVEKILKRNV